MSNEQEKEPGLSEDAKGSGAYPASSSSSDLLDLVRSAEEDARLAIRKRTPATAMMVARAPSERPAATEEEFVDVGDEAIDAPPTVPPHRLATPAGAFAPSSARRPSHPGAMSRASNAPLEAARGLPPAAGIVLVLTLAIGALALVAR